MKRQDGLGRDPDGPGLSQAEPSGLGPSDFDPSRDDECDPSRDDELASIAAINVCVMTNGGCVCCHEDTSPRVAQSLNCKSRYRSARLGISLARASDERPTGPRPSGLGAEPASAIGKAEAPINSVLLSALKAMDEALTEEYVGPNELYAQRRMIGAQREAWIQIRSAISQADGR